MSWRAWLFTLLLVVAASPLYGADQATVNATIRDVAGKPVAGAKLFLYDSVDTRRPADFISPASDGAGRTALQLPPGRYWAVARLKKGGGYGPLMPGDKHSGEPTILEPAAGEKLAADFVIADIRDVGRQKQSVAAESVVLRGRIVDGDGAPVADAYVFASRTATAGTLPDFLSTWTAAAGAYTLYLPVGGRYFVGAARQFPLPAPPGGLREVVPPAGKTEVVLDVTLTVQ